MEWHELINLNLWWKYGDTFEKYDEHLRKLRDHPIKFPRRSISFEKNQIYLIMGARRTGKTVWIKENVKTPEIFSIFPVTF